MEDFIGNRDFLVNQLMDYRRYLHKHPELGWMEFQTTALVAQTLEQLGFKTQMGKDVIVSDERLGLPKESTIEEEFEKAKRAGVDERYLEKMRDGHTGVVGMLGSGKPVTAFRFDLDALPIVEAEDAAHRPFREGFRSINQYSHACGHDGHTAMGLMLAHWAAENQDRWTGTIKLIFQPAEEGCRGAVAMEKAGVVKGVDSLICSHLGLLAPSRTVIAGVDGFFATTKYEVEFQGESAHAGLEPEMGRNAMLAAAAAVLQLHGMERHSTASTRINVGTFQSGTGINVIPDYARIQLEIRSTHTAGLEHMEKRVKEILAGASMSYGVTHQVKVLGHATTVDSDQGLVEAIGEMARHIQGIDSVLPTKSFGASEDATVLMKSVREQGGKAAYMIIGSDLPSGHHTPYFDVDEESLMNGVEVMIGLILRLNSI